MYSQLVSCGGYTWRAADVHVVRTFINVTKWCVCNRLVLNDKDSGTSDK